MLNIYNKFLNRFEQAVGVAIVIGFGILAYRYIRTPEKPKVTLDRRAKNERKSKKPPYERVCQTYVVETASEWAVLYPRLLKSVAVVRAVGLDCEWVTQGRHARPVSLIQIGARDGLVVLVRILRMPEVPDTLVCFLADRSILKVGVAINDDATRLHRDYGLEVSGCVDLRHVIATVGHYQSDYLGLDGLTATVLGRSLSKNRKVRCGNWEIDQMSEQQVTYAAYDGMAAIDIFIQMLLTKKHRKLVRYGDEVTIKDEDLYSMAVTVTQGLVDLPYKSGKKNSGKAVTSNWRQTSYQGSKRDASQAFATRKKPFYHNCRLLAPDGLPLCVTNETKIQWYLQKGLADKVSDDPLTVQLRFEPAGRPESENDYYLHDKSNVCVVCGESGSYTRKQVVPHEYRKLFPNVMKEHLSHDVLLLCPKCHGRCALHDTRLRRWLVDKCSAPLNCGAMSKLLEDEGLQKVKSAARALKLHYDKIPIKRREILERQITDFYDVPNISSEIIDRAAELNPKVHNSAYIPHGEKVVEHYRENDSLMSLELLWRQHFIDSMKPAFLPPNWSVTHNHDRLQHLQPVVED